MKTCAIIMTAYKSQDYILEAINSLKDQQLPEGWTTRFYIGVDGCKETASYLNSQHIPYFYAEENVGTYILSNSLIQKALKDECKVLVRFDSDDVACQYFLNHGIKNCIKYDFSKTYTVKSNVDLQPIKDKAFVEAHGSSFFNKNSLYKLGGYHHYRVGCDTDFLLRAELAGFVIDEEDKPKFLYRKHEDTLSTAKDTGKKSSIRKESWEAMQEYLITTGIKVSPVITTLIPNHSPNVL